MGRKDLTREILGAVAGHMPSWAVASHVNELFGLPPLPPLWLKGRKRNNGRKSGRKNKQRTERG